MAADIIDKSRCCYGNGKNANFTMLEILIASSHLLIKQYAGTT